MEAIIDKLFEIFSLEYTAVVIIVSYLLIKLVDVLNKDKSVPTWLKRVITGAVGVLGFWAFKIYTEVSVQTLLASYFFAIFVYDTAIKFLIKKLNLDYK